MVWTMMVKFDEIGEQAMYKMVAQNMLRTYDAK